MECPNCGQYLDLSTGERYVKCIYCKSTIAALKTTKEYSSLESIPAISEHDQQEIINNMKLVDIDLDNKNYHEAHKNYEKILEKHPSFWEALLNQAVCVFWMGREDFKHMRQVKALLDKADLVSGKNDKVESTRMDIAYNIALIGSKKEKYGDNIFWSIECFKISKQLIESYVERDQIIDEYIVSAHKEIETRLLQRLARDKKSYDPPRNELDCLYELFLLSPKSSEPVAATFIAFADQKLKVNRNLQDLSQRFDEVKAFFSDSLKNTNIPSIHFPIFGTPGIK